MVCEGTATFKFSPHTIPQERTPIILQKIERSAEEIEKSNTPGPLRIWVDYSISDVNAQKSDYYWSRYSFTKQTIIQAVLYYSFALTVINQTPTIKFPDFDMMYPIPTASIKGQTVACDLYLAYYTFLNPTQTIYGWTSPVHQLANGRIITGELNLNLIYVSMTPSASLELFYLITHEMYHLIVFSNYLFDYYINPLTDANLTRQSFWKANQSLGNISTSTVNLSNVLNFAKSFLNDSQLGFVALEALGGTGSAGSHWEHIYWPTDYMTPTMTMPIELSNLSLAAAVDSGWYTVNPQWVQELSYGKGAGRNFQSGKCPDSNIKGFCNKSDLGVQMCVSGSRFKGICYSDSTFSNGCSFIYGFIDCTVVDPYSYTEKHKPLNTSLEYLGPGSRCALLTIQGNSVATCASVACDSSGTKLTYSFTNNMSCVCSSDRESSSVQCTGGAQSGTQSGIQVKCPDVKRFCTGLSTGNNCPSDCNGNGICLGSRGSKICFCMYGWTGSDCSVHNPSQPNLLMRSRWQGNKKRNATVVDSSAFVLVAACLVLILLILY